MVHWIFEFYNCIHNIHAFFFFLRVLLWNRGRGSEELRMICVTTALHRTARKNPSQS